MTNAPVRTPRVGADRAAGTAEPASAERRLVVAAFVSLLGTLGAHALLETARDALVLTHLPLWRLPWLYLAMAALSLVVGSVRTTGSGGNPARDVSISLLVGGVATAGLGVGLGDALAGPGPVLLHLLFLWSGTFAAFVVGRLWALLGESIDMTVAKRSYGRVAAGGGLGAVAGAAVARLLSTRVEPRMLIFLAAAVMMATALVPALLLRHTVPPTPRKRERTAATGRSLVWLFGQGYVIRLMVLAVLAASISTVLDFSFKEAVITHLSSQQLPRFFATFHLITSAASLLLQVFGVALVVRLVGVGRVQVWVPLLLLLGVVMTLMTGGLAAVVLVRGFETAVRSSFQRPTFELLQMPLGDRLRRQAKPIIDAFGQRAGQAVAGLGLLLMFRMAAGPGVRLIGAAALLAVWMVVAHGLGRRYVDMLRATLLQPKLSGDVAIGSYADGPGRATLIDALDSSCALEVRAAVDLLVACGQARMIPLKLLRHPSFEVVRSVVQAIPIVVEGDGASDRVPLLLTMLDELAERHVDESVRSAALRRRSAVAPDRPALSRLVARPDCPPTIRGIALVVLVDQGWIDVDQAVAQLCALVKNGDLALRLAVAESIAERPSPRFEKLLFSLADQPDPEVLSRVAETLGAIGGPTTMGALVRWLGNRETRVPARAALARIGAAAFELTLAALTDVKQPVAVRANVARALVEIDPDRAAVALMDGLLIEQDGFVRFRILRALSRLRRVQPRTELDPDILARAAAAATDSAYRYLGWRVCLEDGASRDSRRRTPTWALLRELLGEKEQNAIERLFRVLTLRYPREDFGRMLRAVRGGGHRTRAAGRELIENLLTGPAQVLTLALIDEMGDRQRFAALTAGQRAAGARGWGPPRGPAYGALLTAIGLAEEGGTLAALATHHTQELSALSLRRGRRPHDHGAVAATHV
ncbi:MAG: HEAT repeat domain-containing protein [Polyangia bacterium]